LGALGCNNNQLTSLDVSQCQNLRVLECHSNKLTSLKLTENLEYLECSGNFLTDLNLSPGKLTFLNISDNNFPEQDLSFLEILNLVNLETLYIGTSDEEIKSGKYNNFIGSLKNLKNLTKLKSLYINNTDIEGDLRYLPEETYCSSEGRPESKVKMVEEALKNSDSFIFNEEKYTRKGTAYFFEENNFKLHLRRNATKE
jgi:Leucine-rich repeat (LRR) protein